MKKSDLKKLYCWRYSIDTQTLNRSGFKIDTTYEGMYEPGDYIKVFYTNSNGNEDYDLIKSEEIESEFEFVKKGEENCVAVFSYSDSPCHAMKLFQDHFANIYEQAKQKAHVAKILLDNVTTRKADIDAKYKESEREIYE